MCAGGPSTWTRIALTFAVSRMWEQKIHSKLYSTLSVVMEMIESIVCISIVLWSRRYLHKSWSLRLHAQVKQTQVLLWRLLCLLLSQKAALWGGACLWLSPARSMGVQPWCAYLALVAVCVRPSIQMHTTLRYTSKSRSNNMKCSCEHVCILYVHAVIPHTNAHVQNRC